jgi:methylthioribose-1-phosphate isomerase
MIDQSKPPFEFSIIEAKYCQDIIEAVIHMRTRGTLTISAAGAFSK